MQSSQHRRYVLNSKVQPASSMAFTEQLSPVDNVPPILANPRDAYLKQEPPRSSFPRAPPSQRGSQYPVKTIILSGVEQQKRALQRYKYINQLARMEFEDKQEEVYSKYTRVSKQTVMKKIKARNQIAEFQDEDQDENQWFDELMEFKFGKEKNGQFHYERDE